MELEDGIWGGIADDGCCTESGVDDSEWSGLEKRRSGMSFQFVCSDTFPHSSSSLPITASLPLSTNHQCMGLAPSLDCLYLRLTWSSPCGMVVNFASVDDTADEVVVLRVPHIFLAPSTFSICRGACMRLLGLSSVVVVPLFEPGVPFGRDCLFNAGPLFGRVGCVLL